MKKEKKRILQNILYFLSDTASLLPRPFESPYAYVRRAGNPSRNSYLGTVRYMKKQHLINITKKNNNKFISLTDKGQLQTLIIKAKLALKPKNWDGKWRLVVFDIPEHSRDKRALLRYLLFKNGFTKLQASVFINPYPLNQDAVQYLIRSGLIDYIRILRIDKMDKDEEIKKHYHLR